MNSNGISVIIPIYNEKEAIGDLPARLAKIMDASESPVEFLLVDDGSNDGTEQALLSENFSNARILRHSVNKGYGAAIKTGLSKAAFPWVAITDADNTYPDHSIPELLGTARKGDLDMVVGARTGAKVRIPLIRRPAKWTLGKLANYLTGRKIPDLNSGLRVMKKDSMERFSHLLPDGFSLTTTITLAMLCSGLNVEFVPINYEQRTGKSKIRPFYDTLNFIQLICRAVLWFEPLRVFIPLSFILFATSLLVLLLSWLFTPRPMDVTFAVIAMSSVVVFAVGLLADLIDKRFPL